MLYKNPRRSGRSTILRVVLAAEAGLFVGGFWVWFNLCNNSDFRRRASVGYPWLTDTFYTTLEYFGNTTITREGDQKLWSEASASKERFGLIL
jgi:hypothetical protein